jgi:predicted transcriptional regulator
MAHAEFVRDPLLPPSPKSERLEAHAAGAGAPTSNMLADALDRRFAHRLDRLSSQRKRTGRSGRIRDHLADFVERQQLASFRRAPAREEGR